MMHYCMRGDIAEYKLSGAYVDRIWCHHGGQLAAGYHGNGITNSLSMVIRGSGGDRVEEGRVAPEQLYYVAPSAFIKATLLGLQSDIAMEGKKRLFSLSSLFFCVILLPDPGDYMPFARSTSNTLDRLSLMGYIKSIP